MTHKAPHMRIRPSLELDWLSTMRKVLNCIKRRRKKHVDIGRIPLNDKKTFDLLKKGDTQGVFGFDSPDMKKNLKQLKPDRFDELMALCGLYGLGGNSRTWTFDLLPEYIARKTGKKKIEKIHPELDPIVAPTYGMIVFQDQETEIISKMLGYSPENAEEVRHMMAKKNPERMAKLEPEFFYWSETRGYDKRVTSKIWDSILPYAGLTGRKDLVSVYTFIAYQFAYLKAHYESEFLAVTAHAN